MAIVSPRADRSGPDPIPIDWYDPDEHRRKLAEAINNINERLLNGPPRALVKLTANESIPDNSTTSVVWDAAEYDILGVGVSGWWSSATGARLTVPPKNNIRRVRLRGNIDWAVAGGQRTITMIKNGSSFFGNPQHRHVSTGGGEINLHSPIINVEDGDYFELQAYHNSGAPLNVLANNQSWFAIEAV